MLFTTRLKKTFIVGYDLAAVCAAWLLSHWFKFNLHAIPDYGFNAAVNTLPIVLLIQCVPFFFFGLYRGVWRFFSIPDLIRIIKAAMVGLIIISAISFFGQNIVEVPRSVPILYSLILIFLLSGGRFLVRWVKDYGYVFHRGKRTLIIGAGAAGEQLARDLLRHTLRQYIPVGFVDDNHLLRGKEIHGIRVLGSCSEIPRIVNSSQIELILIALPSIDSASMRRIVNSCESVNIPFRTLPSLKDITAGKVNIESIREVSIEDLLGRDPVDLDWEHIAEGIQDKQILVTGGGGSIGSELCRQIARLKPREIVVVDQNEFNLYQLEMELNENFPQLQFHFFLADVTDEKMMHSIIASKKPHIIFHAAAYKHVPLLENQELTAIKNNVFGTLNICDIAVIHDVKKFVLISTDKAVNPTNIMGATKRVAELIVQSYNQNHASKFITVRFGNVLGSVGSVVPLFKKQIERGGPITVTHPEITRFFMTIPEATQLILQAATIGRGGEIFVLDMGEPIKIRYLAEQMIRLSGLQPEKDIQIVYSGLRAGEKLYEELFYLEEHHQQTAHRKIFIANTLPNVIPLERYLREMKVACENCNSSKLREIMRAIVPEFNPAHFKKADVILSEN